LLAVVRELLQRIVVTLQSCIKYSPCSVLYAILLQIADGYFVKYFASVTALLVYAAPIYFQVSQ
jgi:hypothetical protein